MKKALIVVGVLLAVALLAAVVLGGYFVERRNQMVQLKESIAGAWAQVDTVIQRRADLIPNLVETVKGVAQQEQKVFSDIADARARLGGAQAPSERIAANEQLSSALSRLLVVVENYPELRSNQNFLRLQDELAGTENRIAVERRKYNQTVQDYNTYIQLFPNNLIASFSGFEREDAYFRTTEEARQAPPSVNFSETPAPEAPAQAPAQ
ncbi:MAG: LemA family protein [Acidobacteria bacterium]|nr:LemA family protein [Acidobacteriota bacterium]